MDLEKIPTGQLKLLRTKIRTVRRKQPTGTERWWFWFKIQIKVEEALGLRYKTFIEYREGRSDVKPGQQRFY